MHGRYEVEDLLKLRASPLVAKPPGLPPKEEWMGPVDTRTRPTTAKKLDEAFGQSEGFQKRPNLLESRRSTTDPERIHLGPPRNSFASSNARTRNGNHERTRTNEEADQIFGVRRSGAYGGINGKFDARTEEELDGSERPRRRNEDSDFDSRPKRDYERPRWGARDPPLEEEEAFRANGRDSYPKRKFDSPWSRKEKPDLEDGERRDGPAWRRGAKDRDYERIDAEPEWADTIEPAQPQAHTHQEFLQWMEKMKKQNTGDDKTPQTEAAQKEVAAERPTARVISDSNPSVDRFFARFEEKKASETAQSSARPTKSRFASIFGSKEEPKQESPIEASNIVAPPLPAAAELEQPAPAAAQERKTNDDAAFANLLAMLNKNETPTPSPAPLPPQNAKSPITIAELATTRSPAPGPTSTAPLPHTSRTPITTHTPTLSLDRLIESRSPAHHAQKESQSQVKAGPQDLLDLLRRSTLQEKPAQQYPEMIERRAPLAHPPGLSNMPPHDLERQGAPLISTRRDNPRSIFDDPAFAGYRNEQEYQQRSPPPVDHGGLGGLFAAMNNRQYNTNQQQDQRPPPKQSAGIQRPPPGFEQGPRPLPAYVSNTQQRQPLQPPPQMNPQHPLYNQAPYPPQQQQQSLPRQMPQRKPTNEHALPPGYSNIPPGFGPPPNYATPTSPDPAMQYAMRGGYGMDDRQRMESERQQSAFAAMYGSGNRGNAGVQLPPGFSR